MTLAVKIKGLKKQEKLIKARALRLSRQAVTDPKLANSIKNKLLLPIKKELTLPSGERVPSFSTTWARRRRILAQLNRTSRFFSNFKSNLTFTGRFLNSFKAFVIKGREISYEIKPTGKHKGYKQIRGKTSKAVQNSDIGLGQIEQGRDYRVLGPKSIKMIRRMVAGRIRREFKLRLNI